MNASEHANEHAKYGMTDANFIQNTPTNSSANFCSVEADHDDDLLLPFAITPSSAIHTIHDVDPSELMGLKNNRHRHDHQQEDIIKNTESTCTVESSTHRRSDYSFNDSSQESKAPSSSSKCPSSAKQQQAPVPGLASSVISSPTDTESQSSSCSMYNTSHIYDSHYLDTAASLLASTYSSKLLLSGRNSTLIGAAKVNEAQETTAAKSKPVSSLEEKDVGPGFSRLLTAAGDTQQQVQQNVQNIKEQQQEQAEQQQLKVRLPVLPEERSLASASSSNSFVMERIQATIEYDNAAATNSNQFQAFPDPLPRVYVTNPCYNCDQPCDGSTTILPATVPSAPTAISRLQQRYYRPLSNNNRSIQLASLAGATANRTGNRSFQVTIDLSSGSNTTQEDVMDLLGNPNMLPLWCDALMSGTPIVVTNSSEGARTASWNWSNNRTGPGCGIEHQQQQTNHRLHREYEGEWIDATTMAPLIEPLYSNNVFCGCLYRANRLISSALGCPTYGKISMFVERQKGQVSLCIGPFVGGVELHHILRVVQIEDDKIRVVDDVKLHDESDGNGAETSWSSCCGLLTLLEQCWLPESNDYMDQVVTSMAKLRFLVENGVIAAETIAADATTVPNYNECEYHELAARTSRSSTIGEQHSLLTTPLLLHQEC